MDRTVLQAAQPASGRGVHQHAAGAVQAPGAIQIAYIGFGSSTGFLAARALQERDRACRIILMDDTTQYAIQGLHLHFADFILRPVEFRHVARSMRLALERF